VRILYIDVDSLRPDHLGCYGYVRQTTPTIDVLAKEGIRFDGVYVSDAPCLPSRTALWSGRFGFRTGVVGHGGTAAQPFVEGPQRGFNDRFGKTGLMAALRELGYRTATVSSFADRHSAWHWYAGYLHVLNPGKHGYERAHQVNPLALEWLKRYGEEDDWFLHVNYWDPHTPYRTPLSYGHPFEGEPQPVWLTEAVRAEGWQRPGPHSPQDLHGFGDEDWHLRYPRVPRTLDSMTEVQRFIDGYDTGVRYMDDHLSEFLNLLADLGVLDETVIMVSADHGESLGEMNIWGDHHLADDLTCRVPLVVRWPGSAPRVDRGLYYQVDWAATLLELIGGAVPDAWDGLSFADAFRAGSEAGRPYLVCSQGAWTCQRGVRFGSHLCLRTYHDGFLLLPPVLLFDLASDPQQQRNLAGDRPDLVAEAMALLAEWQSQMMRTSPVNIDPMMTVLREGGPYQVRGRLGAYLARLRETGRAHHATALAQRYPEAGWLQG
jgi:choline-sulfatase